MNHLCPTFKLPFAVFASIAMLSACGGGGDSGDTSSGTSNTPPTPTGSAPADTIASAPDASCNITDFAQAMLGAVNLARSAGWTCGATYYPPSAPMAWNMQLAQAAAGHSTDMANNNYFSHTSFDGRSFLDRINATGYLGSYWGENIYAGGGNVAKTVDAWLASPGHCANIMNSNFREIGAACASNTSSSYGNYWTQDFAAPR